MHRKNTIYNPQELSVPERLCEEMGRLLHPAHAGTWEQGALIQAGPYATGQLLPPEGRETLMETIGQLSGTVYKPASL